MVFPEAECNGCECPDHLDTSPGHTENRDALSGWAVTASRIRRVVIDQKRFDVGTLTFGSAQAASVRYRVLQFLPFLERDGIRTTLLSSPPSSAEAAPYPVFWIQKKLLPIGKVRALARRHKLVFDFDDAIWTSEKGDRSLFARLRTQARLACVLKRSTVVMAGNDYLAAYARRYNPNVVVVPTVVDTERYPARQHAAGRVLTLGWIGHSVNFKYLAALSDAIRRVAAVRPVRLLVVADQDFHAEGVDVENRRWSEETEVADLLEIDIGLMPLADDEWTRGKCGFKAIQYMAAGVPPVASQVGMNTQLIDHGVDGFLAASQQEWFDALTLLCADPGLRQRVGDAARQKVRARYSLQGTGPAVSRIFAGLLQA
jgi:glycosyltransferase involved in cell wall biosynthesis